MFFFVFSGFIVSFFTIFRSYFRNASINNFCWAWDHFSRAIIILSVWILTLIFLTENKYNFKLLILVITIIITFLTKNSLIFFITFEFSIIPILIIVLFKGYQPERLEAGLRLLLYTFSARTPLLFCILYGFYYYNTFNLIFTYIISWQIITLRILGFLVKLPIWSFHLWLPKAHVEAPVGGSIILAAIILKLGIYGIYRLFILISPEIKQISFVLISIGLWGILVGSTKCFLRSDIKTLIAYRSVAHISPTLIILLQFNNFSFSTIIFLAISHGFSSSLIFFTGNLIYLNSKSRRIILQKGNLISTPNTTFILFWAVVLNLAVPPFLTFFSELLVIFSTFIQRYAVVPIFFILVLLTGLYNIYLYVNLGFGKEKRINNKILEQKEWYVFFMHRRPLVILPFIF